MSKKPILAIFAHPDDEAFGPAGTLAIYSKTSRVSIICVTNGEAGENHTDKKNGSLVNIRKEELKKAAKILGVSDVFFLDYKDGQLCNNLYHDLADKIQEYVEKIKPEILITFEPRGVSGHIDHVVVSLVTHYIFSKVDYVKKLLNFTLIKEQTDKLYDYFIYVPKGYVLSEIDLIVDVESVWETKIKALKQHVSQMKDVNKMLQHMEEAPKKEYFLV